MQQCRNMLSRYCLDSLSEFSAKKLNYTKWYSKTTMRLQLRALKHYYPDWPASILQQGRNPMYIPPNVEQHLNLSRKTKGCYHRSKGPILLLLSSTSFSSVQGLTHVTMATACSVRGLRSEERRVG